MEGKLNLELKVVDVNLSCLNCVKDKHLSFSKGEDVHSLRILKLGTEVLEDYKCEECGCNSFNIQVYYTVKM